MRKAPRPDVGGVGPKLEERFIQRQPQLSSKAKPPKQAADVVAGSYLELFARQRHPDWDCWGNEIDKFEPKYDAQDDFAKSLEEGYRAIRERVAAGGPGWIPK